MSLSTDRSALTRLSKEVADLRSKESGEQKKIADAQRKMNSALDSARRASSSNLAKTYMNTVDREGRAFQKSQDDLSRYSAQTATKTKDIARLQERISKEEEADRKRAAQADDKRRRDDETKRKAAADQQKRAEDAAAGTARVMQQKIEALETQISQFLETEAFNTGRFVPTVPEGETEVYDVFISHASEDKDEFVRELARKSRDAGLRVWYDEFSIGWGDGLREKIDQGLRGSYFGVAVLSPHFFAKPWTSYELDGLVERTLSGRGRLLPIWHRVTKDDVAAKSPSLANRLALNTSLLTSDDIVTELVKLRDLYRANAANAD